VLGDRRPNLLKIRFQRRVLCIRYELVVEGVEDFLVRLHLGVDVGSIEIRAGRRLRRRECLLRARADLKRGGCRRAIKV
jgi:hypothetical protein